MSYKNGKDILPHELLKELQKYIKGEFIYIPKPDKKRAGWGEVNGTRKNIKERNFQIYNLYKDGLTIDELVEKYHLSRDSIRKIVNKINRCAV